LIVFHHLENPKARYKFTPIFLKIQEFDKTLVISVQSLVKPSRPSESLPEKNPSDSLDKIDILDRVESRGDRAHHRNFWKSKNFDFKMYQGRGAKWYF
jgi:hypothetical protein